MTIKVFLKVSLVRHLKNKTYGFASLCSLRFIIFHSFLTHWGRVTHICVNNRTIIVSDNGLSPGWRQTIIWTNAGIQLIGPLGTNFSEISIGIQTFSFKKMHLKMSSAKWRPLCLGLNVLKHVYVFCTVVWSSCKNNSNTWLCFLSSLCFSNLSDFIVASVIKRYHCVMIKYAWILCITLLIAINSMK